MGENMKKLAVKNASLCYSCLTCENACAAAFYKKRDASAENLSCVHVEQKDGKLKIKVCVQCGTCAKNCESGAIKQNDKGVYMIDKKLCINCGKCVESCPAGVMVMARDAPAPSKCIACGICVKACPQDILYIKTDEIAA
jgi:Fe-S-cluster-containing hydrogenase component 2